MLKMLKRLKLKLAILYRRFLLFLAHKIERDPDFEPAIIGYNILHVLLLPLAKKILTKSQESTASARLITLKVPKDISIDGIIIPVYIDETFRIHEVVEIIEAMREWERAVKGLCIQTQVREISWRFLLNLDWANIPTIINAQRGIKKLLAESIGLLSGLRAGPQGRTLLHSAATLIINTPFGIGGVAIHELGHVLSNSPYHSTDEKSIMYPYGDRGKILSEEVSLVTKRFYLKERK